MATGGDGVEATVLTSGKSASVTLSPGRKTYFTLDVALPSAGERATVHLRLQREGGDPVLMASVGQWPVVDLDAQEDMVRAHVCAFDAFHADAEVHALVVHDATSPREQHASNIGGSAIVRSSSAKDPRLLAVRSPPNAVRWGAIGVHNDSLVKQELSPSGHNTSVIRRSVSRSYRGQLGWRRGPLLRLFRQRGTALNARSLSDTHG